MKNPNIESANKVYAVFTSWKVNDVTIERLYTVCRTEEGVKQCILSHAKAKKAFYESPRFNRDKYAVLICDDDKVQIAKLIEGETYEVRETIYYKPKTLQK